MIPVIDIDGYPTEETVEFLSNYKNFIDAKEAIGFAMSALEQMGYATIKKENNYIYIATGGWSGCEDIIRAMKKNIWFSHLLIASLSGGGYYYANPFIWPVAPKSHDFKVTVTYKNE
jgi:hypothetical protein